MKAPAPTRKRQRLLWPFPTKPCPRCGRTGWLVTEQGALCMNCEVPRPPIKPKTGPAPRRYTKSKAADGKR